MDNLISVSLYILAGFGMGGFTVWKAGGFEATIDPSEYSTTADATEPQEV